MCVELVIAAYRLLKHDRASFCALWNWGPIFKLMNTSDERLKSFVYRVVVLVLNVSDSLGVSNECSSKNLFKTTTVIEYFNELSNTSFEINEAREWSDCVDVYNNFDFDETKIKASIVTENDFPHTLVDICGFVFHVDNQNLYAIKLSLTLGSDRKNLYIPQ